MEKQPFRALEGLLLGDRGGFGLSWKKELRMLNWKDIRQISKNQQVKNQKVYFSIFRN
jgi:hypothetical protein